MAGAAWEPVLSFFNPGSSPIKDPANGGRTADSVEGGG